MRPQVVKDVLFGAQVGEPVPGEDALHGHRHVFSVRGYRFEEPLRATGHISV